MAPEFVKVSDYIGAEVRNVNLTRQTPELHEALRRGLAEHAVLFFRDQHITPQQHAELARGFGDPFDRTDPETAVHGYSFMGQVTKDEEDTVNIGGVWHIDQTYQQEPPTATILVARILPDRGGDTLFSSMAAAYDALSEGYREMLDGLSAVHSRAAVVAKNARLAGRIVPPDAIHPVVIRNPITGRKSLYVTRGYTVRFDGWTAEESAPILNHLFMHGQLPEFQCRFKWALGSIAIWDNTQIWHYATNDYHGRKRVMDRITVTGFKIAAARAA